ncbi:LysR family transcriptional regulator [Aestuariicoccus sp. MJ-SS9]|uniref:LysR family transcriptional regulator n=1 Tax=Aestuariicoccus sp. MJ-SS9 TaxID=3079855 RepID=UPI002909B82E|nr:LysR family transcriptional regulator [Aestuariicoccus sp. MJ-SS9]MDU8910492.1 LysR family transcriptional regulator [Aestuariicoccus sp. MJ-SS9]
MSWTALPSLNALRAFAVLAETGSYSRAGLALNVTHGAIVQQVKALERDLDLQLVARAGRGVVLTEEGARLARDLNAGFRTIRNSIEALRDTGHERPVQVTMSPAFAVQWLMPRLAEFQTQHPEITLMLNPSGKLVELRPGGMDLAIRYARKDRLPEGADVLLSCDLLVVGTPELVAGRELRDPADLLGLPWLQELGTDEVAEWCARHGLPPERRPGNISHMPGNLILRAVRRGDGLTYTVRSWVADALESGALVGFFAEKDAGAFHIHTLPLAHRPAVRHFIRWLKRQAAGGAPLVP